MPILVECGCGRRLRAKEESAGRVLKCPACSSPITVPKTQTADVGIDLTLGNPIGDSANPKSSAAFPDLGLAAEDNPFANPEWEKPKPPPPRSGQAAVVPSQPPVAPTIKNCFYCGEEILAVAKKCKHCGEFLDPSLRKAQQAPKWNPGIAALLSLLLPGAGQMYKGQVALGVLHLVGCGCGYAKNIYLGLFVHFISIIHAAIKNPEKKLRATESSPPKRLNPGLLAVFVSICLLGLGYIIYDMVGSRRPISVQPPNRDEQGPTPTQATEPSEVPLPIGPPWKEKQAALTELRRVVNVLVEGDAYFKKRLAEQDTETEAKIRRLGGPESQLGRPAQMMADNAKQRTIDGYRELSQKKVREALDALPVGMKDSPEVREALAPLRALDEPHSDNKAVKPNTPDAKTLLEAAAVEEEKRLRRSGYDVGLHTNQTLFYPDGSKTGLVSFKVSRDGSTEERSYKYEFRDDSWRLVSDDPNGDSEQKFRQYKKASQNEWNGYKLFLDGSRQITPESDIDAAARKFTKEIVQLYFTRHLDVEHLLAPDGPLSPKEPFEEKIYGFSLVYKYYKNVFVLDEYDEKQFNKLEGENRFKECLQYCYSLEVVYGNVERLLNGREAGTIMKQYRQAIDQ